MPFLLILDDHSRVVLTASADNDYINGNYIKVSAFTYFAPMRVILKARVVSLHYQNFIKSNKQGGFFSYINEHTCITFYSLNYIN
jgi:hypothetical protein